MPYTYVLLRADFSSISLLYHIRYETQYINLSDDYEIKTLPLMFIARSSTELCNKIYLDVKFL